MAAQDMSPKAGKPLVENQAGSYLAWSGKDQPAVAGEKLGCGLLVLKPLGFALPHYADSGKFGYVLGGSAVVGVLPVGVDARERVVRLEAGDVIAVRAGEVSWWYNDADGEDVTILFMGDTAGAVSPGDISYFILAGPTGVLGSLDAGLLATASGLTPEQAATAFRSQPAALLTKLSRKLHGVRPREHDRHGLVVNAACVPADGTGGAVGTKTVTAAHLPLLDQLGFSVGLARLEAGAAVRGPWVLRDAAAQAVYVARGSGRVQVAGAGGASTLLDAEVAAGSLLVVPRYAVALVAGDAGGMELVSLIKSPRPAVEHFTGKGSVLGGLTPEIVQATLNVSPELVEQLRTK
ncbi:hypothetical protein E2562_008876 [Oryza meyeriana var. granulata]|uniref:Cupin type-1 domain-containing protein n=1 Tax=Oryza meyeriana var. granulata TaxID=110450 RepID=A0A6G1D0C6_9ORYZ|nr:hypothetical protein E2562_008876 [Oryza meyeriana var. granulata]